MKPLDTAVLPPEVADVIAEDGAVRSGLAIATAARHVVVAGASPGPAFLFRPGSGEPLALDVPRAYSDSPSAPALRLWRSGPASLAVAALARDGVLRVYPVDVARGEVGAVWELRLGGYLRESAGDGGEVEGLEVVDVDGGLVVFGSRGSAVRVNVGVEGMTARALERREESSMNGSAGGSMTSAAPTGSGFGSSFFSALRGVVGDGGGDGEEDWAAGSGNHAIVGVGKTTAGEALSIRSGGCVEKWGYEALAWSTDVCADGLLQSVCPEGAAGFGILEGAVSSEDVIALLVQYELGDQAHMVLVTLDGSRPTAPAKTMAVVDMGALVCEPSEIRMTVSADILFVFMGSSGVIQWRSFAAGVPEGGQISGQREIDVRTMFYGAGDMISGSTPEEAQVGGLVSFISTDCVVLISALIPAPLGLEVVTAKAAEFVVGADGATAAPAGGLSREVFRCAYLQYNADQTGAAKATLTSLISSLRLEDGSIPSSALDDVVLAASISVVDTVPRPGEDSPSLSLLIDSQLQSKVDSHLPLRDMLADTQLLSSCDISGQADSCRLWDLLSNDATGKIVAHAEKLAAAHCLRRVQNRQASRGRAWRAGSSAGGGTERSVAQSSLSMTASLYGSVAPGEDLLDDSGEDDGVQSIVATALCDAGRNACKEYGIDSHSNLVQNDPEVALYSLVSHFDKFLPALRSCVDHVAKDINKERVDGDGMEDEETNAGDVSRARRSACRQILRASDAACTVVHAARELREETQGSHSFEFARMERNGGWSCDVLKSRPVLKEIADIALRAAKLCRPREAKDMRKCAVEVCNALLKCARSAYDEDQLRSGKGGNPSKSPHKRRRLDKAAEVGSVWGRERKVVLTVLRENGLSSAALKLAREYEDFGMMLSLKCNSNDFDAFFEEAVQEFGDEFAYFAFEWLEKEGKTSLLLFGSATPSSGSGSSGYGAGRSDPVKKLLKKYFDQDRAAVANLSWMLQLASGEFSLAAKGLVSQAKCVAVPGKVSSLPNAKVLFSIAKLALYATQPEGNGEGNFGGDSAPSRLGLHASATLAAGVDKSLYLLRAQNLLDGTAREILPAEDLVNHFLDAAPIDSSGLTESICLALETIAESAIPAPKARELRDHVWKYCIERQAHLWLILLNSYRSYGDEELRLQLRDTALYGAARNSNLSSADARDLQSRGVFSVPQIATGSALEADLGKVVRTTLGLVTEDLTDNVTPF